MRRSAKATGKVSRREVIRWAAGSVGLGALGALAWSADAQRAAAPTTRPSAGGPGEFHYHHDRILGTSLDLVVVAPTKDVADSAEATVLAEIKRLDAILSSYDPDSGISKLNRSGHAAIACPPELVEVLRLYETWQARSQGGLSAMVGILTKTWDDAEKAGKIPDDAALAQLAKALSAPGWQIDKNNGTVSKTGDLPINTNAIGKGYIIDKAVAAARAENPKVTAILVNIGGDLYASGPAAGDVNVNGSGAPWRVGIADPAHPQDNSARLLELGVLDQSVSTSAPYARGYSIAGKRYSHIFDPRTGKPVEGIASATVIARSAATSNALATALNVLPPSEGLDLVKASPGAECLVIASDGKQYRSPGFAALVLARTAPTTAPAEGPWPVGYELNISLTLPANRKRPFVAFWIEDARGTPVRTLAVWGGAGKETKYLSDLTKWWAFAKQNRAMVSSVTRATRGAGQYTLVWDGKTDDAKSAPPGTYTVRIEAAREKGGHVNMSAAIDCLAKPAKAAITANSEVGDVALTFGPHESKP